MVGVLRTYQTYFFLVRDRALFDTPSPHRVFPVLMLIGFLAGMVCYSLLAGAGYRHLRYVNKPGIEQDQSNGAV